MRLPIPVDIRRAVAKKLQCRMRLIPGDLTSEEIELALLPGVGRSRFFAEYQRRRHPSAARRAVAVLAERIEP